MPALHFDRVPACTHWAAGRWQDDAVPPTFCQVTTAGSTRRPAASGVQGTVTLPTWTEANPDSEISPHAFLSESASGGGENGRPKTAQLALPPLAAGTAGDLPSSAMKMPISFRSLAFGCRLMVRSSVTDRLRTT